MSISSYFRLLFYYYYLIVFSINGIFGFHYKLCILVLFPILNMLFIIYIINFSFKNFHEIFFQILVFSMRPCGPRFMSKKNTIQNHLLLFPPPLTRSISVIIKFIIFIEKFRYFCLQNCLQKLI